MKICKFVSIHVLLSRLHIFLKLLKKESCKINYFNNVQQMYLPNSIQFTIQTSRFWLCTNFICKAKWRAKIGSSQAGKTSCCFSRIRLFIYDEISAFYGAMQCEYINSFIYIIKQCIELSFLNVSIHWLWDEI